MSLNCNTTISSTPVFIRTCIAALMLGIVSACGDGGGEASLIQGGSDDDMLFVSVHAKIGSLTAPFSNEIQVPISSNSITLTWEEPTRSLDGACLTNDIDTYIVNIGNVSGQYQTAVEISKASDSNLSCSAGTKTDTQCGKTVMNCRYPYTFSTSNT